MKRTLQKWKQTENENHEDIQIPISHVSSSQIDTSHQPILFHQLDQSMDPEAHNCYLDNQIYQQQTSSVYTLNVQAFQPTQLYTINSHPFQPTSANIMHDSMVADSQRMDSTVIGASQDFQHWAPLEDVSQQTVPEARYQTIGTFSYHDQQPSCKYPTHQQHCPVTVSSSHPVRPLLDKDIPTLHLHRKQKDDQSLHGIRHSRKRQTSSVISPKKKSAEQTDKGVSLKKYFQQAAVTLFFNERLKSPGKLLRVGCSILKMSSEGFGLVLQGSSSSLAQCGLSSAAHLA